MPHPCRESLRRETLPLSTVRLRYLSDMLSKYRNAYYRAIERELDLSSRMYGWMDEYDAARGTAVWADYCAESGKSPHHTATDIFA